MSLRERFAVGIYSLADQTLTLTALRGTLASGSPLGQPAVHHSDQGIQYAAYDYDNLLRRHEVQISTADKGEAWQNGYAERLILTIKEEGPRGLPYLSDYHDLADAFTQISRFIEQVYQYKRIGNPMGASLGYLTPEEFEDNWKKQQQQAFNTPSLIPG